jgi:hypothetical protein
VLGPLVLVPQFLVVATFAMAFHLRWKALGMALLVLTVPVCLQAMGWLRASYQFGDGTLRILPWALSLPEGLTIALMFTCSAVAMLAAALFAIRLQRTLFALVERTELNAWQLEQMSTPERS